MLHCESVLLYQGPEGDKTVQMAIANPERFVLKPQLEGGGILKHCNLFLLGHGGEVVGSSDLKDGGLRPGLCHRVVSLNIISLVSTQVLPAA